MEQFQLDLYKIFNSISRIEIPPYVETSIFPTIYTTCIIVCLVMALVLFSVRNVPIHGIAHKINGVKRDIQKVRKERFVAKNWSKNNYNLKDTDEIIIHSLFTNVINYIQLGWYYVYKFLKGISIAAEFFIIISLASVFLLVVEFMLIDMDESDYKEEYVQDVLASEFELLFEKYENKFETVELPISKIRKEYDNYVINFTDVNGVEVSTTYKGKTIVSDVYKEVTLVKKLIPIPSEIYDDRSFPTSMYNKYVDETLYIPKDKVSILKNQSEISN